jgi:hypothetical protein
VSGTRGRAVLAVIVLAPNATNGSGLAKSASRRAPNAATW